MNGDWVWRRTFERWKKSSRVAELQTISRFFEGIENTYSISLSKLRRDIISDIPSVMPAGNYICGIKMTTRETCRQKCDSRTADRGQGRGSRRNCKWRGWEHKAEDVAMTSLQFTLAKKMQSWDNNDKGPPRMRFRRFLEFPPAPVYEVVM